MSRVEQGAARGMVDDEPFVLDGIEFVPSWHRPSQPGSLTLLKARHMVELYAQLLAPYPRPRMVELGIRRAAASRCSPSWPSPSGSSPSSWTPSRWCRCWTRWSTSD